jgi:hypothetical protein
LRTNGSVEHIAADGARVAFPLVGDENNICDRVVVWNPTKRTNTRIKTSVNCETASVVNDVPEIALAGKRVAWLEASGGNDLDLTLRSRVLGSGKTVTITGASNGNGAAEDSSGGYVGNLFGNGNLLVFNSWSECTAIPVGWVGGQTCPNPAPGDQEITNLTDQELLKVVGGKEVEIASAPDAQASGLGTMALTVVAVDAGRIVTQQPDGSVTLYSTSGGVLQHIAVPTGKFSGFALQGSQLVTLRNGNLELYSVNSSALVKTIPLAAGSPAPVLRDLQSGLAVYVRGLKVHVVRLSNGRDLTIRATGGAPVDAQIDTSGLFYSYNWGCVVFVPFATVLKRLG